MGNGTVLFHGKMGIALIEKSIFEDLIRLCKPFAHLAKLKGNRLLDIRSPAPRMDPIFPFHQRVLNSENGREHFVVHLDEAQGLLGNSLASSRNGCHRITHVADLFRYHGLFVLGRGHNAKLLREFSAGNHGKNPIEGFRLSGGDVTNPCMRMRAAQQFSKEHSG